MDKKCRKFIEWLLSVDFNAAAPLNVSRKKR